MTSKSQKAQIPASLSRKTVSCPATLPASSTAAVVGLALVIIVTSLAIGDVGGCPSSSSANALFLPEFESATFISFNQVLGRSLLTCTFAQMDSPNCCSILCTSSTSENHSNVLKNIFTTLLLHVTNAKLQSAKE